MKKILFSVLLLTASLNIGSLGAQEVHSTFALQADPQATVCFTPGGDCTDVVVNQVAKANGTILVQAYSFISDPIAEALCDAENRGVKVQAILDRSDLKGRGTDLEILVECKIPTFIDYKHAIAHNKIIIIDEKTILTGSFNFTKAAQQHNAENLLVLHDPTLAALYLKNWKAHWEHAEEYSR